MIKTSDQISLGRIALDRPVVLAPMCGVTDRPFRELVAAFGASMVVNEMIAGTNVIADTRLSRERTQFDRMPGPRVVQLAGCDPGVMAEAARRCEAQGADIIDINMGCPVKKVVHGFAGSALMRDLGAAARIIAATVRATALPVTLKMRTGWDDDSRNAPELARIAEAEGIGMVTVHGRTRSQRFTGRADWRFIAAVKRAVGLPVIANGDIGSLDDARRALRQSGADGVMIGRGAYGRPWFLQQVMTDLAGGVAAPEPTVAEQCDVVLRHHHAMLSHYGRARGTRIARKHLNWYLDRRAVPVAERQALLRSDDDAVVRAGIRRIYDGLAARAEAA